MTPTDGSIDPPTQLAAAFSGSREGRYRTETVVFPADHRSCQTSSTGLELGQAAYIVFYLEIFAEFARTLAHSYWIPESSFGSILKAFRQPRSSTLMQRFHFGVETAAAVHLSPEKSLAKKSPITPFGSPSVSSSLRLLPHQAVAAGKHM